MISKHFFLWICFLLLILSGCKKFVDVGAPVTSTNAANVFETDESAISVLNGIYTNISRGQFSNSGVTSMSLFLGMSADELSLFSTVNNATYTRYYSNALSISPPLSADYWSTFYPVIFAANSAVEGLEKSTSLTPAVKQSLLGEALFVRAFSYFYLTNLYGDVPLILTSDFASNSLVSRTAAAKVYAQIVSDLKSAEQFLGPTYSRLDLLGSSSERVRPNKYTASALLSRVYLFTADWNNAEIKSSEVIGNKSLYDTVALGSVFLKNSKEAIWQIQPVIAGENTKDAITFTLPAGGPNNSTYPVSLDSSLVKSFVSSDKRRSSWIGSVVAGGVTYYYPSKYKALTFAITNPVTPPTEYYMVMRLAEQYLIRAEARVQLGKLAEGQQDLNTIRTRAGAASINSLDKDILLAAALQERRMEFFTEWGHRWLDIKRTNKVNDIMAISTPNKGGSWSPSKAWFPIPLTDISTNPNLIQNAGY